MPTVTVPTAVLGATPPLLEMDIPDGDAGTLETIDRMRDLVDQGKRSPRVQGTARRIVSHIRSFDRSGEVRTLCQWVKQNIRFRNDARGIETLQTPDITLDWKSGDCDDFSTLLCALLESIGVPTQFVAAATNPRYPQNFSHVYPQANINGRWLACDMARRGAQVGKRPARVFRSQAFASSALGLGDVPTFAGYFGDAETDGAALVSATGSSIADILAASHPQSSSTFISASGAGVGPYGIAPGLNTGLTASLSSSSGIYLLVGAAALLIFLMRR
jgi:hypothetical protein